MTDGLLISTGLNDGKAQVFNTESNKIGELADSFAKRRKEEQAAKDKQAKTVADNLKLLDSRGNEWFLKHDLEFTEKAEALKVKYAEYLTQTDNKLTPEMIKDIGDNVQRFEDDRKMSLQIKQYHDDLRKRYNENPDLWDQDHFSSVIQQFDVPFAQFKENLIKNNGKFPDLQRKEKPFDAVAYGNARLPGAVEYSNDKPGEQFIATTSGKYYKEADIKANAITDIKNFRQGTYDNIKPLVKRVEGELAKDPAWEYLTPEEREAKVDAASANELVEIIKRQAGVTTKTGLKNMPKEGGNREYGGGFIKTGNYNFSLEEQPLSSFGDKSVPGAKIPGKKILINIERNDASENKPHQIDGKDILFDKIEVSDTGERVLIGKERTIIPADPKDPLSKEQKIEKIVRIPFKKAEGKLTAIVGDDINEIIDELVTGNKKLTTSKNVQSAGISKGSSSSGTQTQQPQKKEIKRSDVAAKAKAAGYTVAEYEKLLKQNGVTIIN
jgi:hypothetical protein